MSKKMSEEEKKEKIFRDGMKAWKHLIDLFDEEDEIKVSVKERRLRELKRLIKNVTRNADEIIELGPDIFHEFDYKDFKFFAYDVLRLIELFNEVNDYESR